VLARCDISPHRDGRGAQGTVLQGLGTRKNFVKKYTNCGCGLLTPPIRSIRLAPFLPSYYKVFATADGHFWGCQRVVRASKVTPKGWNAVPSGEGVASRVRRLL